MKIKNYVLVLGITLCGFTSKAQSGTTNKGNIKMDVQWMQGEWRGVGYQVDGATWDVVLVNDSTGKIKVSYPTLGCAGSWEILTSELSKLVLIESIEEGKTLCDQGSSVIVNKVTDTHISLSYSLLNLLKFFCQFFNFIFNKLFA